MQILKIAVALVVASLATPSFAAGPSGNWACTVSGDSAGTLSIDGTAYSYAAAGAAAGKGEYSIDSNMIRVTSGPLKELGISLGYFNETQTPALLVFSMGAGKGMKCSPA